MISAVLDVNVIAPPDTVVVTGDPEDDHVLATAAHGQAEYLITGDKKLLALARHSSTQIISPREALDLLSFRDTPE